MKTWDMKRTIYRVSDFLSWQRTNSLLLSPSFQRRPVWLPGAKSFLLDTIVRGLPIPIIFLREQRSSLKTLEPSREVVDGQQRLRTIFAYVDSGLLKDFNEARDAFSIKKTHNKELANKDFSDLPSELQQRILDYEFSVHVLPSQVDDREILQIFARMNATGVKLNDQELRNAEYFGEFKASMYELASEQLQRWREWKIFTEYNIARMEEVEITSEFALLMLKGLTGKTQASLNRIYKEKDQEFPERVEVERRFRIVMEAINDKLGNEIRFLLFSKKTLFYSLFALFYDLLFNMGSPLQKEQPKSIQPKVVAEIKQAGQNIQDKNAPEEVLDAVGRRTTNIDSRRKVLKYLREKTELGQVSR